MRLTGSSRAGDGFSLIEVLCATTILTIGVGALAQLLVISTSANRGARVTTLALLLAQDKMEQLHSLTWGFDSAGSPATDSTTDTTVVPERESGGRGLSPSPRGSLGQNIDGYCDFLDAAGQSLGGGTMPPVGAVFVRRWSIEPVPSGATDTVVLQVLVTTKRYRGAADQSPDVGRLPDETRLVCVKTRKAG